MLTVTFGVLAQEVRVDTLVPVQKNWQAVDVSHWSVAVKGGIDNFLLSPPAPSFSDRINPTFGVGVEYTINPFFGLGLEYEYSDYTRPYIYSGSIGSLDSSTNDLLLTGSTNLSNVFIPYRIGFWRKLNVYGDVGAGIALFKGTLDGASGSFQTALMGKLGLNAEFVVSKLLSLSLEGRYHQYDALYMCEGSRSNRNGDALMVLLGMRLKLGSGLHARTISLVEYAPKTIPIVSKTTFVKGEMPKTMSRISAVE